LQVITWFQNRRAKLKRDLDELKADVTAAIHDPEYQPGDPRGASRDAKATGTRNQRNPTSNAIEKVTRNMPSSQYYIAMTTFDCDDDDVTPKATDSLLTSSDDNDNDNVVSSSTGCSHVIRHRRPPLQLQKSQIITNHVTRT
jgi:hypothetical protein